MKIQAISKNFGINEFIFSNTANIKHIDNTPTDDIIYHLSYGVLNILQPLRDYLGKPIKVSSGYRSPALNKAVSGSNRSQHLTGNAVDIVLPSNTDYDKAIDFLLHNGFVDQLINEYKGKYRWLHISWSLTPRHQYFTQTNL